MTDFSVTRPPWVKQGEDFHHVQEKLWERRNLSRFKLKDGKTYHNFHLSNIDLACHGIVDMVIETKDEVYAAEFKLSSSNKKRGDKLQVVAYALLLEKYFSKTSPIGFLLSKDNQIHTVTIDAKQRTEVLQIINAIQNMLKRGMKPDTSATYAQCCNCEYINFCHDRA